MKNNPTISIIVPVYNVENYLPLCIKSIQNQTFTDFECILIDDGSTDTSKNISDNICLIDRRFKVIHKKNQGVSSARNIGIDNAKGQYISFIDADDYIHPQMLEILYWAIQNYTTCSFSMIYGKQTNEQTKEQLLKESITNIQILSQEYLLKQILGKGEQTFQYDVIWNKLYPKSLLKNKKFIEESYSEDTEFNSRIYIDTKEAILVPLNLYYYVQRKSSITHQVDIKFIRRLTVFYKIYNNFIPSQKEYRAWALEKIYKTILNVRYHTFGSQNEAVAKLTIKNIKDKTFSLFLKNKEIPYFRKYGLLILLYIKPLYNLLIWYNNRHQSY